MTTLAPRAAPLPAELDDPREAAIELDRHAAVLDAARRIGEGMREQVELLHRIVEYAVRGADLVDEMRQRGELVDGRPGRPVKTSAARTFSDLELDRRRVDEWRTLRDLGALGFLEKALADGRASTFERVSLRWVLQRVARIAREAEHDQAPDPGYDYEIRHGDLRTALDDLVGDVDAVITDPPYGGAFLDEFDALGEAAARLLTPDGLLVVMVGQMYLPAYLERLGAHLEYRWCGAYLTDGPAARVHGRRVGTKWKPLLIFDRGNERAFLTQDVFTSTAAEKLLAGQIDGWGQSESGMADVVARVTRPGQLVVDPFLGGGTTAVVCHELGRRFVGCDTDPDAVRITRERLER